MESKDFETIVIACKYVGLVPNKQRNGYDTFCFHFNKMTKPSILCPADCLTNKGYPVCFYNEGGKPVEPNSYGKID